MREEGVASPFLSVADHVLDLAVAQSRIDDLDLPLHSRPVLSPVVPLDLGIPLNGILEPLLERGDLAFANLDVLNGKVILGLPDGDERAQIGVPLSENLDAVLNRGVEVAGVLCELAEVGGEGDSLRIVGRGEGEEPHVKTLDLLNRAVGFS